MYKDGLKLHIKSEDAIGRGKGKDELPIQIQVKYFHSQLVSKCYKTVNQIVPKGFHMPLCYPYLIQEAHISVLHLFSKQWPLNGVQAAFQTLNFH